MEIIRQIKTAFILLLLFTLVTGLIYPFIVTGIAQLLFPWQANGSFIVEQGKIRGSLLIGQPFTSPNYFWSRPSATIPFPYNASHSSGSNLGPSNPKLLNIVKYRVATLQQADPNNHSAIPVDLVTASASGLDPEISLFAALYQVPRIAKARGLTEKQVEDLIQAVLQVRTLGILGEPRVNVLQLNLALDRLRSAYNSTIQAKNSRYSALSDLIYSPHILRSETRISRVFCTAEQNCKQPLEKTTHV